jgi:type I restriction enzyme S subunit
MGEWKEYKLGDVAQDFAMGPFGSNIKAENFQESGVPVIRGKNLNFPKYVDGDFVFLSEEKADQLKSSNCYPNDLVFTHRGTIGQVAIVPEGKFKRYVVSQSGMKLSVNKKYLDHNYLFYFFKSNIGQHELLQNESQVGVPSISSPLTSLKSVTITLPPLPEQRAIASVLSSLDDKIELLHHQNRTLEAMAETLFRQWFVEEADEEWEECTLNDLCTKIASGGTPSTKIESYYNGNINWYSTKELNDNFLYESENKITEEGLNNSSAKLFSAGTVVIAIYAAPTVGRLGILANEASFNQAACGLVANEKFCNTEFIYLYLKNQRNELNLIASGSAQQNLNVGKIKSYPVFKVSKDLMNQFKDVIQPLFSKINSNTLQIHTLEKLRDTLLPKLMSGEVRVELSQGESAR